MNQYGIKSYWDKRYQQDPEPYDWYQKYSAIKPFLGQYLARFKSPRILILGCGNSRLSEELYMDGFKNILNIDYSPVCIQQMSERYADYPEMKFMVMDCTDMTFEDSSFDIIIDKGTLDSVLCSEGASDNAHKTLKGIFQALQPVGIYFCLSYGIPNHRLHYLKFSDYNWGITTEKLAKPVHDIGAQDGVQPPKNDQQFAYHYLYICDKSVSA